jgi:hypothetical protein
MARLPEIPIPAPPFPELPEGWVHDAAGRPSVGMERSPKEAEALADGLPLAVLRGAWGGLACEAYATRAAIRMILRGALVTLRTAL